MAQAFYLSEWSAIDGDDGALDEGLGSDQLVGGSVVNDVNNSSSSRDSFASPTEVTVVQSQGSEFQVASHTSDGVNSFWGDFSVSGWSTEFELSLLMHLWLSATGLSSLVP